MDPPQIEGRTNKEQQHESKKEQEALDLEQASQMDIVKPRAVDEVKPTRDVVLPKPEDEILAEAKIVQEKQPLDQFQATRTKAKTARASTQKRLKVKNDLDAAQGAPPANPLVDYREHFEKLDKRIEEMQKHLLDLKTVRAQETPLQPQKIFPPTQLEMRQDLVQEESVTKITSLHDVPKSIPFQSTPASTNSPIKVDEETEFARLKRKYAEMERRFQFVDDDVRARVKQAPTAMGQHTDIATYGVGDAVVYF